MCKQNEAKIEQLKKFDLDYFLDRSFVGGDSFQNTFVFQPKFNMVDFKEEIMNVRILLGNEKGYTSKVIKIG